MEIDPSRTVHSSSSLRFGAFVLDTRRHTLHRGGERLHLTSKQVETLAVLVANPWRLLKKQELLDAVWKDAAVTEDNLVQAIGEIRRVLGEKKGEDRFIQTVHRRGYRFVASVESGATGLEVSFLAPPELQQPGAPLPATTVPGPLETRDASWISFAAVGMVLVGVGLAVRFVGGDR